jgi:hypothetical protein
MRDAIMIRHSTDADRDALDRLAQLDGRSVPSGASLLAYVDGELRAAVPLDRRAQAVADPFHLTGDVVELLRLRATQEKVAA